MEEILKKFIYKCKSSVFNLIAFDMVYNLYIVILVLTNFPIENYKIMGSKVCSPKRS